MRKFVFLCLALFWTGVVAYFCLTSSSNIPASTLPNIDKLVHLVFHFGFTIAWFLFWKKQLETSNDYKALLIAFVLSVFFGVTIEILQGMYTLTRSPDVHDVLANTIGATLAISVVLIRNKFLNKIFS